MDLKNYYTESTDFGGVDYGKKGDLIRKYSGCACIYNVTTGEFLACQVHEREFEALLGKEMPIVKRLFVSKLEVRDGEHEYLHYDVVEASSRKQADRMARKRAENFLGSRMKWTKDRTTLKPTGNNIEYRIIKYSGVQEVDLSQALQALLQLRQHNPEAYKALLRWIFLHA